MKDQQDIAISGSALSHCCNRALPSKRGVSDALAGRFDEPIRAANTIKTLSFISLPQERARCMMSELER